VFIYTKHQTIVYEFTLLTLVS